MNKKKHFDEKGGITDLGVDKETSVKIIRTGETFFTAGYPNCNRPYCNEKPSGPIYNYPRPPTKKERREMLRELAMG